MLSSLTYHNQMAGWQMGERMDGPSMGVSGASLKTRGQRVADHFSTQLPKSHLRAHIYLSEGRDGTVIPQPHSGTGLVRMYQTRHMMTKCICWTQQGHCTHEHTVAPYVSLAPTMPAKIPACMYGEGAIGSERLLGQGKSVLSK